MLVKRLCTAKERRGEKRGEGRGRGERRTEEERMKGERGKRDGKGRKERKGKGPKKRLTKRTEGAASEPRDSHAVKPGSSHLEIMAHRKRSESVEKRDHYRKPQPKCRVVKPSHDGCISKALLHPRLREHHESRGL